MAFYKNNFSLKFPLKENKNHLIDRLDLTPDQKEKIKAFFLKHPSYESKIDWNDKSLSYKNFEPLLALDGKSKTQAKKYGLSGLVEEKDYFDFGEATLPELGRCHLYQPLSYKGSVTLASNKVPPVKDNGAQWCISYQKTGEYWYEYTKKGIKFLFAFTENTKYALTIFPKWVHSENKVFTFEDVCIYWPEWCTSSEIVERISDLKEIPKLSLEELLDKYQGILIKNPDGTIDKVGDRSVMLSDFIKDGRFLCKFNKWEGDFDCSHKDLSSLEGAPEKVGEDFICSFNRKLTSLKGAPEEVRGNFDCSYSNLTSLKGAPREIEGDFDCCFNSLTSLEGAPVKVGGDFDCSYNYLTSLGGAPEEVGGTFIYDDYLKVI